MEKLHRLQVCSTEVDSRAVTVQNSTKALSQMKLAHARRNEVLSINTNNASQAWQATRAAAGNVACVCINR